MNIHQVAICIKQGSVVRRRGWEFYDERWDGLCVGKDGRGLLGRVGFDLQDLLADDWEVVPTEQAKGKGEA